MKNKKNKKVNIYIDIYIFNYYNYINYTKLNRIGNFYFDFEGS